MGRRAWLVALTILTLLAAVPLPRRSSGGRRPGSAMCSPRGRRARRGDGNRAPLRRGAEARPSRWPYVLTGAAVGLAAVARCARRYARTREDCFCGLAALVPHLAGGTLVGGLAGAVVYEVRHGHRSGAGAGAP